MHNIEIKLAERSYSVFIEHGLIHNIGKQLKPFNFNKKIALISGEHVSPLYKDIVEKSLIEAGFTVLFYQMPSGEHNKNMSTVQGIYDALLELKLDRSSSIIALGGGVIGDTAGFVAATLFRGINFIQIPTSLLSQVDSSVGGKVGINHSRGKNLIGAIYQPKTVLIDPGVLKTLDYRERISGFSEILKYGLIHDQDLYEFLIRESDNILNLKNENSLLHVIKRSVEIKAEIVSKDEYESNLRMILNFGHTVGHAIENTAGYGVFTHGEAVLIGMIAASFISWKSGLLNENIYKKIRNDLQSLAVKPKLSILKKDKILRALQSDKKVKNGKIRFVLLKNIGETIIRDDISQKLISESINMIKELKFAKE